MTKKSYVLAVRFMFLDHSNILKIHPTNMSEYKTENWTSSECLTTVNSILKYTSFPIANPALLNTGSHIQLCTILP